MTELVPPTAQDLLHVVAQARDTPGEPAVEPFSSMEVIWLISWAETRYGVEFDLGDNDLAEMSTAGDAARALGHLIALARQAGARDETAVP
ncbi:hypothetical protein [Lentzea sp. NPDC059081]|uniref:hypothetical protein n=1 Tax=Lentzea sp. NPDC059081 TaxID=3346719 RepID=UPI003690E5C9